MGSSANPLNSTKEYYPPVNNAVRGNTSGSMFQSAQVMTEEARPKDQYAGYKDKPVNTNFLKIEGGGSIPKYQGILVQRFRKALKERGGRGISGLGRQFKIFDDNNSGDLDMGEFTKACKDYKLDIEEIDIQNLYKTMDIDGSGSVDYNEFLRVIVGEMSQMRENLVIKAFKTLDVNGDGEISV